LSVSPKAQRYAPANESWTRAGSALARTAYLGEDETIENG
jgi:hypothetical protein